MVNFIVRAGHACSYCKATGIPVDELMRGCGCVCEACALKVLRTLKEWELKAYRLNVRVEILNGEGYSCSVCYKSDPDKIYFTCKNHFGGDWYCPDCVPDDIKALDEEPGDGLV